MLREKYTCTDFLTSVFSFMGILLICKPAFLMNYLGLEAEISNISYRDHLIGISFSLTSAIFASVVQIIFRKFRDDITATVFYAYNAIFSAVGSTLIEYFVADVFVLSCHQLVFLFFISLFSFIGNQSSTRSFVFDDANTLSIFQNVQIVISFLFDIFILRV